ncbi:flagellar basal body protein FliL [Bordetella trematum]|uniref:Flagellar protein FliL n=1 Tax=Bordetella trematum TaxID=123899 RepID=A0A157JS44_9BORD|nr:flagellar basal body-associated FliL family protein [Bordetella trematum]AUL47362.1 flagellar basal body protein FliL [Bordetella trematum]AZR94225.1 flagellar basal body protein FliL [Bordetella trematum]NNH21394.1 flagellar basal body protein FliL [Bordetella trematum]QIM72766.1 flagellar basal body protein FliL [Bordetella trematum]SAH74359.1 flagellar protein [Bordetella trematum]
MATNKSSTAPAGGSGKLLRIVLALLLLLIVVVASVAGTWYFLSRYQQQQQYAVQLGVGQNQGPGQAPGQMTGAMPTTFVPPPAQPAVVPAPIFIPLEAFTVTLSDGDNERILHLGLTLRVSDDQSRQRIERYMPEVRNRVLMVLSSQKPQVVQSLDGKLAMAKALQASINRPFAPLPDGQYVTDVLFTAFVVQ